MEQDKLTVEKPADLGAVVTGCGDSGCFFVDPEATNDGPRTKVACACFLMLPRKECDIMRRLWQAVMETEQPKAPLYAGPAYAALLNTSGNEIEAEGCARIRCVFGEPREGHMYNENSLMWRSLGRNISVSALGLYGSQTAGVQLALLPLEEAKSVGPGYEFEIEPGNLYWDGKVAS